MLSEVICRFPFISNAERSGTFGTGSCFAALSSTVRPCSLSAASIEGSPVVLIGLLLLRTLPMRRNRDSRSSRIENTRRRPNGLRRVLSIEIMVPHGKPGLQSGKGFLTILLPRPISVPAIAPREGESGRFPREVGRRGQLPVPAIAPTCANRPSPAPTSGSAPRRSYPQGVRPAQTPTAPWQTSAYGTCGSLPAARSRSSRPYDEQR